MSDLKEKIKELPDSPGVYLMKDEKGEVIYVGKAKNLKNRVRSYFQTTSGDTRYLKGFLERLIHDIEIIVTRSEKEAILLENTLIKQYSPRYNIRLKDDKDFLFVMINFGKEFPYLELIRRPEKYLYSKERKFFGPYHSAKAARRTVRIASRYFKLRVCSDTTLKTRKNPCVLYQLGYCSAPCAGKVSPEEYRKLLDMAVLFLSGRYKKVIEELEKKMKISSQNLEFEKAAYYRDQIRAIEFSISGQAVEFIEDIDADIFGYYQTEDKLVISVVKLREGKIIYKENFGFKVEEFPLEERLSSFLFQYYRWIEPSPLLLLPVEIDEREFLEEYLSEKIDGKVNIKVPKRGVYKELLDIAMKNAKQSFEIQEAKELNIEHMLKMLQYRLRLKKIPYRIECVDIAHLSGTMTTASLAVMIKGEYSGELSRLFNVSIESGDDYSAMYEVLKRRFSHAIKGEEGWELPQLLVVDGGRGQLNIAKRVLKELNIEDVDIIAIAKDRGRRTGDLIYTVDSKTPIKVREADYLYLISRIRDEAHRLAGKLHSLRREKRYRTSILDKIPDIGEKRKKLLLSHFKDIEKIKNADIEELASIKGIGRKVAEKIYKYFHSE